MNEEMNLSQEELGALLGDSVDTGQNTNGSKSLDAFKDALNTARDKVAQSMSQNLGDEVELAITVEEARGIVASGDSPWYVSKGAVSTSTEIDHYFVFPSVLAQKLVAQFLKIEDVSDDLEQVAGPLLEMSEGIINAVVSGLEKNLSTHLDEYTSSEDLSSVAGDASLIKVEWNVGEASFFEYFHSSILDLYSGDSDLLSSASDADFLSELGGDDTASEADNLLSDMGLGIDDNSSDFSGDEKNKEGILSGLGEDEDESLTLGDALLGLGSQSVSSVKMPSFDGDPTNDKSDSHNSINMLKDVTMDVTVELGSTKKLIGEILELNRGSIIELKKLAGEPLDVKINNKLIARGEVVVIDEYFGVRIIEVISPYKKPTSK